MSHSFFAQPILNAPDDYPSQHGELDTSGQPTQQTISHRRSAEVITPIPRPKKRRGRAEQQPPLPLDAGKGLSTADQQYNATSLINELRRHLAIWRRMADPAHWGVTPETARLLQHGRTHPFSGVRPVVCQIEAIETVIWLTEVAPRDRDGKTCLDHLERANADATPHSSGWRASWPPARARRPCWRC